MVKKSVVDYVRNLLQRGYNPGAIRDVMFKYGYTNADVEDAIAAVYGKAVHHGFHMSHSTFMVIFALVVVGIMSSAFFFINPPEASTLIEVDLTGSGSVAAGGEFFFNTKLINNGDTDFSIVVKQEVLDPKSFQIITTKTDSGPFVSFGSSSSISIPAGTTPGDYILRTIVEYEGKKAVGTMPLTVSKGSGVPSEEIFPIEPTCFDGIRNQNEEGVDCGGVCSPCSTELICDDNDACTNDFEQNGKCTFEKIVPCCGNNVCEENEVCSLDCQDSFEVSSQSIDEIKLQARDDPKGAIRECKKIDIPEITDTCISNVAEIQKDKIYCDQITVSRIKDICLSEIGKVTNDNSICSEIEADSRRDSCYMTFVLDNKDYSVCPLITNKHLKQSCQTLKKLNTVNG